MGCRLCRTPRTSTLFVSGESIGLVTAFFSPWIFSVLVPLTVYRDSSRRSRNRNERCTLVGDSTRDRVINSFTF
ncbi:DUF7860 family protein [Natronorubrum sp. DTA28]|uniref:DUF7860 family protein n=1 Tax=Natronorubrum sp. DTA28 TaxID=3447019 RepID=UPI003F841236